MCVNANERTQTHHQKNHFLVVVVVVDTRMMFSTEAVAALALAVSAVAWTPTVQLGMLLIVIDYYFLCCLLLLGMDLF